MIRRGVMATLIRSLFEPVGKGGLLEGRNALLDNWVYCLTP
jgi:hypothetical protein